MTLSKIFAIGFTVCLVGFFAWQISLKSRFDNLRERVSQGAQLKIVDMDESSEAFLTKVKDSWEIQTQEVPDPIFTEIFAMTGMPESVAGVAEFYTHQIPAYSFFSPQRNAREATIALAMAVSMPVSMDGKLYKAGEVCFVKLNDACVEVFEDTGGGLQRSLYYKGKDETAQDTNGTGK